MTTRWPVNSHDLEILRALLRRKRDIANDPVMEARKQQWLRLSALDPIRPMLLAETSGVIDELVPLSSLQCREDWARSMERGLRELIFRFEQVGDDSVVEPWIQYGWQVTTGDFGVTTELIRGANEGKLGSYTWDPPLKDLERDLDKLHFRALSVDRESTAQWGSFLEEQFGDILPVRRRANYWWTTGLTWSLINLIGLETMMLAMYDHPQALHRLMAFLRDDFLAMLDWFEREDLLSLNNENDYTGSGTQGWTTELPQGNRQAGAAVGTRDMWGLSESQETVGVSPGMFDEFIFPYQLPVISRFGLSYYGCCEPVHTRWHIIKRIPNLRRVSVSPWCNEEKMAAELGREYIFCRKPNPALISTGRFDEAAIREDVRTTLRIAGDGCLEFAMKDVHTLAGDPRRLGRWVTLAREVLDEFGFTE